VGSCWGGVRPSGNQPTSLVVLGCAIVWLQRMGRSIDHVLIPLSRTTINLPRASREALLEQLKHLDSMWEVRKAFEDVGTSRPVQLTQEKDDLLQVIVHWTEAEEGYDRLPEGDVPVPPSRRSQRQASTIHGVRREQLG
jgi:hypothetical protein